MILDTHQATGTEKTHEESTHTQDMIRRASKEVRRAVPPWGLIVLAAIAMGLAVACFAQAFGH